MNRSAENSENYIFRNFHLESTNESNPVRKLAYATRAPFAGTGAVTDYSTKCNALGTAKLAYAQAPRSVRRAKERSAAYAQYPRSVREHIKSGRHRRRGT